VELVDGATITEAELMDYAKEHIHERAAFPKHLEIMDELPKTAVGKVFKPALRKSAITRVFNAALEKAGHAARVEVVLEDKKRGLVAKVSKPEGLDETAASKILSGYATKWDWAD
jgi:acyl-CoA synthetase (AMP-forming)/AMP-acid ligase II